MSYTNGLDNPELYFQTKLYTGNGSTQSITLDGSENMQPDWTWIKSRSEAVAHVVFDSVRGAGGNKELTPNETYAEGGNSTLNYGFLSSFNSDGFSVSQGTSSPNQADYVNKSSQTYASWNWKAGGSASSNSNGSITSSVSANTTAGFSIATYTGTGSNANVGHGLSSAPELIITKSRGSTTDWKVHTSAIDGSWDVGTLNSTSAFGNSSYTASTNSIFYVGSGSPTNASSTNYVSYLLHSVKGYSKIGSYTGNGNADGTFIYTGFKPSFVLQKKTSGTSNWVIYDNKRDISNVVTQELKPDVSNAESSFTNIDILSNGFKQRSNYAYTNNSGGTYIYMAFAESPFTNSNRVPTNAR